MPVISAKALSSLRNVAELYMTGTCIIYSNSGSKDAMGVPSKIFTTPRPGNIYPVSCILQQVDRVPHTGESGASFQSNTEYDLKLPWGTLVEKGDQVVITDDTGKETRIHVLDPFRHTSGLTLTIRGKDIS